MSVIDNEIKKLATTLGIACVALIIFVWIASNFQGISKWSTSLVGNNNKPYFTAYSFNIDITKKYEMTVETNIGTMIFDLDVKAAPNTVNNIYNLYKDGFYDKSTLMEKQEKYFLMGKGGSTSQVKYTIDEEINADSLNLSNITVSQYKAFLYEAFSQDMINQYLNLSVKEFYKLNGYKYNNDLNTKKIKKGSVVMYSEMPGYFGNMFFISIKDSLPEIDGRMTNFGTIISGQEILDTLINTASKEIVLNSIKVEAK